MNSIVLKEYERPGSSVEAKRPGLNVDKRQRMFVQEIPPTGNTLRNSSCSCTRVLVFVHCFDHFNCSALLNCESLVPTCKDGERYVILLLLNVDNCVNCAVCVCMCQHVNTFVSLLRSEFDGLFQIPT